MTDVLIEHRCDAEVPHPDPAKPRYMKTMIYTPCPNRAKAIQFNTDGSKVRWLCGIHVKNARKVRSNWHPVDLKELDPVERAEYANVLTNYEGYCLRALADWRKALAATRGRLATLDQIE